MVPSMAGGLAEACEVGGVGGVCNLEMHCCCPFCLKRLCAMHWQSSRCPGHSDVHETIDNKKLQSPSCLPPLPPPPEPPLADEKQYPSLPPPGQPPSKLCRLSKKTTVPAPMAQATMDFEQLATMDPKDSMLLAKTPQSIKGGWLKCQHPACDSPQETLYKLTGRKQGFEHFTEAGLKVCTSCRKVPLIVSPQPAEKQSKKRSWRFLTAEDIDEWQKDTPEKVLETYQHTADKPMLFTTERWQLAMRVACLIERSVLDNALTASKVFKDLRLTRQKISDAFRSWTESKNKVELANNVPKAMQLGRYKTGWLTPKQKCDLVAWVRLRQAINVPVFKTDVKAAMCKLIDVNTAGHITECTDKIYFDWRDWVRKNVADSSLFIKTSSKAKALRQIEANALTRENLAAEFDRLEGLLRRQGIAVFDKESGQVTITEPSRLWCTDEKGFNDDRLSGHTCIVTADYQNPTSQHSKSIKHISVLTCLNAAGEAAPPAVVLSGSQWHPDWKAIWPAAVCAATPKGSFNGELFVQLIAETFVHHVRVTLNMTGKQPAN